MNSPPLVLVLMSWVWPAAASGGRRSPYDARTPMALRTGCACVSKIPARIQAVFSSPHSAACAGALGKWPS